MGAQWGWVAGSVLTVALLTTWLLSRDPETAVAALTSPIRWTLSFLLPLLISGYGLKKRSLDPSGAALAVVVGFLLTAASTCFSVSLIVFFITSSRLTKWRAREKKKLEDGHKEGGQRNWVQVVCNGGVASLCALLYLAEAGMTELPLRAPRGVPDTPSLLSLATLAALCCCCGDTWASEVGSVIGGKPRLITSWTSVPMGTNGGITVVGVACSIAGGAAVGLGYFLTLLLFWREKEFSDVDWFSQLVLVWLGAASGLLGSLVDSLLGATLQFSGFSEKLGKVVNAPGPGVAHVSGWNVLDNHTVNFLSSLITAALVPIGWAVWTSLEQT